MEILSWVKTYLLEFATQLHTVQHFMQLIALLYCAD